MIAYNISKTSGRKFYVKEDGFLSPDKSLAKTFKDAEDFRKFMGVTSYLRSNFCLE